MAEETNTPVLDNHDNDAYDQEEEEYVDDQGHVNDEEANDQNEQQGQEEQEEFEQDEQLEQDLTQKSNLDEQDEGEGNYEPNNSQSIPNQDPLNIISPLANTVLEGFFREEEPSTSQQNPVILSHSRIGTVPYGIHGEVIMEPYERTIIEYQPVEKTITVFVPVEKKITDYRPVQQVKPLSRIVVGTSLVKSQSTIPQLFTSTLRVVAPVATAMPPTQIRTLTSSSTNVLQQSQIITRPYIQTVQPQVFVRPSAPALNQSILRLSSPKPILNTGVFTSRVLLSPKPSSVVIKPQIFSQSNQFIQSSNLGFFSPRLTTLPLTSPKGPLTQTLSFVRPTAQFNSMSFRRF